MSRKMPERYDARSGTTEGDKRANGAAVPGLDPSVDNKGAFRFTLDVDGERFAAYQYAEGGWNYDWLTGPNQGYGFGSFGPPTQSMEEHQERVRSFLRGIDPSTGYLADS